VERRPLRSGTHPDGDDLDRIGNTPLVRLRRCIPSNGAELWLKLEYRNPSGSMNDRMALAMIGVLAESRRVRASRARSASRSGSAAPRAWSPLAVDSGFKY
jgi:cysteine synthase A